MRFLIIVLAVLTAACSPQAMVYSAVNQEDRALAEGALRDLGSGKRIAFVNKLHPDARPQIEAVFSKMAAAYPGASAQPKLLQFTVRTQGNERQTVMQWGVENGRRNAVIDVTTYDDGKGDVITSFYVTPIDGPIQSFNSFKDGQAGAAGWAMIAAMAAALSATIAALVRIWRRPFARRWLWTLGALVGVTALRLNWTTGEWSFQPIYFLFLSVAAVKTPVYAPWVLSVSLPLVALIALFRRLPEDEET
jgi:hypothetical protein